MRASQPGAVLIGPDTGYRAAKAWLQAYLPLMNETHLTQAEVTAAAAPAEGAAERAGSLLHAVTHHVYPGISRSSFNQAQVQQ